MWVKYWLDISVQATQVLVGFHCCPSNSFVKTLPRKAFLWALLPRSSWHLCFSLWSCHISFLLLSSQDCPQTIFSLWIYSLTHLVPGNKHFPQALTCGCWRVDVGRQSVEPGSLLPLCGGLGMVPSTFTQWAVSYALLMVSFKYAPLIQILPPPAPESPSLLLSRSLYLDTQVT